MLLLAVVGCAATANNSPAECDDGAFCATYEQGTWNCKDDPNECREDRDVMLHMRIDHNVNSDVEACVSHSNCTNDKKCVARQCHTLPDKREEFQVAAATCASLGPEFVVDVTFDAGCTYVNCTGGNATLVDHEMAEAYSCALCAGYAARTWGSTVRKTGTLSCKVDPPAYFEPHQYILTDNFNATEPEQAKLVDGDLVKWQGYKGFGNETFMLVQTENETKAYVPLQILRPVTAPVEPYDENSCTDIYRHNMFIARERTYELEPVTGNEEPYLLVGIFPDAIERQMMPHTITVPLLSSAGDYTTGLPPQLRPWDANLRNTSKSDQHDPHNEISTLWRFVTSVTQFGVHVFGTQTVKTVDGSIVPPALPPKMCTIIPPYTSRGAVVQPDPVCCQNGNRQDGCTPPAVTTYGLNHLYMRQEFVCGILSAVSNPLFLSDNTRKIAPFADFLVVPQRWTADTPGCATRESVKDIDRTPWNKDACRPLNGKDWCLRRDYGVTTNDGTCVFRAASGEIRTKALLDICVENGTLNDDCAVTVDSSYVVTTTAAPEVQAERRRCNGTDCIRNNTGCRHASYTNGLYVANASWVVPIPRALRNTDTCGDLCDISTHCLGYTQEMLSATCTHWYEDLLESTEAGVPVLKKQNVEGGCYHVQHDANVGPALLAAQHAYNIDLNSCYDMCDHHNCTHLVYDGRLTRCAFGKESLHSYVNSGGDGLYATRNEECICPAEESATTSPAFPVTATFPGFQDGVAYFGVALGNGKYACGSKPEWVCPLFRSCNDLDENCALFNLTTELSGQELFYDPGNPPKCTGSNAELPDVCTQFPALFDGNVTTTVTTTVTTANVVVNALSVEPTVETDTPVVEIIISSVIGGCGLILIGAGFYYRKRLAALA